MYLIIVLEICHHKYIASINRLLKVFGAIDTAIGHIRQNYPLSTELADTLYPGTESTELPPPPKIKHKRLSYKEIFQQRMSQPRKQEVPQEAVELLERAGV